MNNFIWNQLYQEFSLEDNTDDSGKVAGGSRNHAGSNARTSQRIGRIEHFPLSTGDDSYTKDCLILESIAVLEREVKFCKEMLEELDAPHS